MPAVVTRRSLLALAGTGLAGCAGLGNGDGTPTPSDNPAVGPITQQGALELTSPAFDDGGSIPREYGRAERDVNPPLRISGVPADAASLALVMDDPDAVEVSGKVWLHWLVWNIDPDRREIPEDWDGGDAVQGRNDFDERGYSGPDPPDDAHTYRFKCFAVEHRLDLPTSASKGDVGNAMGGSVLAQTQLTGTYAPG